MALSLKNRGGKNKNSEGHLGYTPTKKRPKKPSTQFKIQLTI